MRRGKPPVVCTERGAPVESYPPGAHSTAMPLWLPRAKDMSATRYDHWCDHPDENGQAANPRTGGRRPKNRFQVSPSWQWLFFNTCLDDDNRRSVVVGSRRSPLGFRRCCVPDCAEDENDFVALVEVCFAAAFVGPWFRSCFLCLPAWCSTCFPFGGIPSGLLLISLSPAGIYWCVMCFS